MAVLFKANRDVESVKPANGKRFTLEELQALVDGYIEVVALPFTHNWVLVVNEEGLLMRFPCNENASIFAETCIVGDAILCKRKEIA